MSQREMRQFPPVESMPAATKCRLEKALRLLADTAYHAAFFRAADDVAPAAHRWLDLLRDGATLLDCRLLMTAGYVAPLPPKRRGRRRGTSSRSDSRLDEQTFVVLTEAGKAFLAVLENAGRAKTQRDGSHPQAGWNGQAGQIHYNRETRELFLGRTRLLSLATKAQNMSAILESFEDLLWPTQRIPSPFRTLPNGKRSQTVRDAIHGLKECQDPLVIEFHSCQKGAMIWYEVLLENLPCDHVPERAGRP